MIGCVDTWSRYRNQKELRKKEGRSPQKRRKRRIKSLSRVCETYANAQKKGFGSAVRTQNTNTSLALSKVYLTVLANKFATNVALQLK